MRWIAMLGLIVLGWALIWLREYDLISRVMATITMTIPLTVHLFWDWGDV